MLSAALHYDLPPEAIATFPAEPRDSARLMHVRGQEGAAKHRRVRDLPELLRAGDALVFNASAVLPARIIAHRAGGGRIEGLALEPAPEGGGAWRFLLKGSARLREGEELAIAGAPDDGPAPAGDGGAAAGAAIALLRRDGDAWIVAAAARSGSDPAGDQNDSARRSPLSIERLLDRFGHVPLPPYIRRARSERGMDAEDRRDRAWYQTVYADPAAQGSVAAPTAGLHFTPELLAALDRRGVRRIEVVLHVGAGTFKPVETERVDSHPIHRERYRITAEALAALRRQRAEGGRIVAVGTTTARVLESLPPLADSASATLPPGGISGSTDLMIVPGHRWRNVDALITNFHLPRSTLLALVAALVGLDRLKALYAEAIREGYRFYSYGDAMLIE
ncbi:MAG TPA: tRNA preQ1(34) S-adenosylmethionine ribosyltransferase-isomerase QueA [Phycisphaerales bacterium]|nr:tRNA preQ1(34) S-adenosylmethionine ribosyltransferase-isomerase QueA [Phycisphaerales bacterium]HMP36644.1 tRNA preQ1(34) S-adenosylmethionine ribosyltransferase-isomerase QueA [Phycisphaerales bacterium]